MYQNPAAAIKKIATFLEIPFTDEILEKTVAGSTISEMKEKASIGLNHLRQGGYGGWRNYFTVSQNEFFDDVSSCVQHIDICMNLSLRFTGSRCKAQDSVSILGPILMGLT